MENPLSDRDKRILLELARRSLTAAVRQEPLPLIRLDNYSENLRKDGASFVTLTKNGQLRGCIGILEARQPLVQDVAEHAIAAGLDDYRFQPVQPKELDEIEIEISRLTPPEPLSYDSPEDLLDKLLPGIDGLILRSGRQRATFLPQVWKQIPTREGFLSQLCLKMGASPDLWRIQKLDVSTYKVEEFSE